MSGSDKPGSGSSTAGPRDALAARRDLWRKQGGGKARKRSLDREEASARALPGTRLPLFLAGAALAVERVVDAGWPLLAVLALFFSLAFFGALPALGPWLHATLLLGFVAAAGFAARRLWRRLRWPSRAEAWRRLERDSGFDHRPLETLRDRPASGDAAGSALWQLHQKRLRERLGRLKVKPPQTVLAGIDRYGLRFLTLLILSVAVVAGWGRWDRQLADSLVPDFYIQTAGGPTLDLWITAPDYTRQAPIFLASADGASIAPGETVAVPAGSTVTARVAGSGWTPKLALDGDSTAFKSLAGGAWEAEIPVEKGGELAVRRAFGSMGAWQIDVIADAPPNIALTEEPSETERATLKLSYEASDDYGLAALGARIDLAANVSAAAEKPPISLDLPLAGDMPVAVERTSYHDLTAHLWAGLPVRVTLWAEDGQGQRGSAETVEIILPERKFTDPVAISVIEQRRQLAIRPEALRDSAARTLRRIAARPESYDGDIVTFLLLRSAAARLAGPDALEQLGEIEKLMWETALHIEDGGVTAAQDRVRQVQRDLMEALEDESTTDEKIQALLNELEQESRALMQSLMERLQQMRDQGMEIPDIPPEMAQRMMEGSELQRMLEELREMSDIGAREAAKQMLSKLQEALENFDPSQMQPMSQAMQEMVDIMDEIDRIRREQEDLLDETYARDQADNAGRQAQQRGQRDIEPPWEQSLFDNWPALDLPMPPTIGGAPQPQGQAPPPDRQPKNPSDSQRNARQQQPQGGGQGNGLRSAEDLAAAQQELRLSLGEAMRRLGNYASQIPPNLGQAEQAMRKAQKGLESGMTGEAMDGQRLALEQLQQGSEQMAQQMFGGSAPMLFSFGAPQRPRGYREGEDPLGNRLPSNRGMNTDEVQIPDQQQTERLQEILRELRNRAGDFGRSPEERRYIERLLDQF